MTMQRLLIGNVGTGFENDRTPFNIDNDAFPVLNNSYLWRGRAKRKRGTALLGRLQRDFTALTAFTLSTQANGATYTNAAILADPGVNITTVAQPNPSIVPGTLRVTVGGVTFVDNGAGVLVGTPGTNSGSINYSSGALTLNFTPALGAPTNVVLFFSYFPSLPVLGIEDFETSAINFPTQVSFDTTYAYQFNQTSNMYFDVSFYKDSGNRVTWTGQDYQQFGTCNYYNALWVTNQTSGIATDNPGMQFKSITTITFVDATHATLTIATHGLIVNDFIWVNEVAGTGFGTAADINGLTGQVTAVVDANNVTVQFPDGALIAGGGVYTGGIAQYLTQTAIANKDPIRWYDGFGGGLGFVNFSPPLTKYDPARNPLPAYLVGGTLLVPFKDRLCVFGYYFMQSNGLVQYANDGVAYSQNGTPYYYGAANPFTSGQSILPLNITYSALGNQSAWYQTGAFSAGKGGFIRAGIQQQIVSVGYNQDLLLVDFESRKTKFIYTSNDLLPFYFQTINTELGTESTFSAITLDAGVLSIGEYGIAMTSQFDAKRVDLQIPDQIFQISNSNQGIYRVNAARDFKNEWIYFSYPSTTSGSKYPTQTLLYNYRENSWGVFLENFTHHGNFRASSSLTWATVGMRYPTWEVWTDPWNAGNLSAAYPLICAGNQQGFVMLLDQGTGEGVSAYIKNITVTGGVNVITSPNHSLSPDDFIYIVQTIGTPSLNMTVRRVTPLDTDTFSIDGPPDAGAYLGGGIFIRIAVPFIQTKQFPNFWDNSRQMRFGTQKFLFDNSDVGQVTVNMYVSQDSDEVYNTLPGNTGVIFSNIILTGPEPFAGSNIPLPQQVGQEQIWHRNNQSLLGDTVQLGFTLSDAQIRNTADGSYSLNDSAFAEITLHAISIDIYPGPMLSSGL